MITIGSTIKIPLSEITLEQKRKLQAAFTFTFQVSRFDLKIEKLYYIKDDFIHLPCNIKAVQQCLGDFTYQDTRICPHYPKQQLAYELRANQRDWFNQFVKYGDAILAAPTSGGKTFSIVHFANLLETNMLFVASQISYLNSFKSEVEKNCGGLDDFCLIDSKWDGKHKKYMMASIQFLSQNLELCKELKIGLLVADEIHKAISSEVHRKPLYVLNPKHRLFLSATPEHKVKGFAESCLSANVIQPEENAVPITYKQIVVKARAGFYYSGGNFNGLLKALYTPEYVLFICDFIESMADRYWIVYNDRIPVMNAIKSELVKRGIAAEVLNSKNSKFTKEILDKYENNEISVLIGSTAIVASISLYRADTILNTAVTLNKNSVIQLRGRLKRFNPEINPNDKRFYDISYHRITTGKSIERAKVLKKDSSVIIDDVVHTNIVCTRNGYEKFKGLEAY